MARSSPKKPSPHKCRNTGANLEGKDWVRIGGNNWLREAAVKEGKFKAEDYGQYSMMKYKGSELAPLGTFEAKIPKDIVEKTRAKEKAILDGKFTVKVNDTEPKSTAK